MLTHDQLMADGVLTDADGSSDRVDGISRDSIRCVHEGTRAVAVGGERSPKTQIAALLDLLDLHVNGDDTVKGQKVDPGTVTLLLGGRPGGRREAVDAVRTLVGAIKGDLHVDVLEHGADGWSPIGDGPFDPAVESQYDRWAGLLAGIPDEPPDLVTDVVRRVGLPALRAYPMLSGGGLWSLRVEGLEVGRLSEKGGWLDVGKDGKEGGRSDARIAWQSHVDRAARIAVGRDEISRERAVTAVKDFARTWTAGDPSRAKEQNEHALESRILRGAVTLSIDGRELALVRPHETVSWGSQFPTKWGRDGSARYLDALLRDGRTPWAIEMKVQGSGGVSQYYRHSIAQAVLYREFIRGATPLHGWFDALGLDASACRAAVVVPEITDTRGRWLPRLEALCAVFETPLLQVPHEAAALRPPAAS